jgi:hypothetical protein
VSQSRWRTYPRASVRCLTLSSLTAHGGDSWGRKHIHVEGDSLSYESNLLYLGGYAWSAILQTVGSRSQAAFAPRRNGVSGYHGSRQHHAYTGYEILRILAPESQIPVR